MILGNWSPHGWPPNTPTAKPVAPQPVNLKKKYLAKWDINYTVGFKKPPVPQFRAAEDTSEENAA